jgi:hypothetical protein
MAKYMNISSVAASAADAICSIPVSIDAIRDISDHVAFSPEVQELEIVTMNCMREPDHGCEEEDSETAGWTNPTPYEVHHEQAFDLVNLSQTLKGFSNLSSLALVKEYAISPWGLAAMKRRNIGSPMVSRPSRLYVQLAIRMLLKALFASRSKIRTFSLQLKGPLIDNYITAGDVEISDELALQILKV